MITPFIVKDISLKPCEHSLCGMPSPLRSVWHQLCFHFDTRLSPGYLLKCSEIVDLTTLLIADCISRLVHGFLCSGFYFILFFKTVIVILIVCVPCPEITGQVVNILTKINKLVEAAM